ncbi:uncharacterized protein LOC130813688 isoform X2 [Amaranthus tricolor]|uniref:uncharacterized protein LOC130813688 isoform X2 n=1 Tax=Amaranthus tricolor TaxID=29722 RepID=UPI00258E6534|nr:uncharacterized protein LOC130813688 isoform X2 [Amaranthus tricolor]XP_057535516.1 uncharacterized protein LOC130813688 isoform X2 [Amaranthus tricolor]
MIMIQERSHKTLLVSDFLDSNIDQVEDHKGLADLIGRRSRLPSMTLITNKTRSHSSSPSINRSQKASNNSTNNDKKLQRFRSCSILHDLEQEELKGFMDLGFRFEKDQLSPRTMTVIPALQRLGGVGGYAHEGTLHDLLKKESFEEGKSIEIDDKLPYLSEAWMVKKPNSPLLRMKMARVSRAQDMKKCLKLWARTVASSIQSKQ